MSRPSDNVLGAPTLTALTAPPPAPNSYATTSQGRLPYCKQCLLEMHALPHSTTCLLGNPPALPQATPWGPSGEGLTIPLNQLLLSHAEWWHLK